MTILSNDAPFAPTPIAEAAGSNARVESAGLIHGAAAKRDSLKLEDAARIIRETAKTLWRGSFAAIEGLMRMLLNFFRWITRPFRERPRSGSGAPADGQGRGAAGAKDVNRLVDGPARGDPRDRAQAGTVAAETAIASSEAPPVNSGELVPDDYLGQDEEVAPWPGPGLTKKVKLAFPAGFSASKLTDELPLSAETVVGAMERLHAKAPDLNAVDPSKVPVIAAIGLLEEFVSEVTRAKAKAQDLDAQIKTQLVALAATGDIPADQLLGQVLASNDLGGLPGAEIRRLHAERVACDQTAEERQRAIESSLLSAKQQGLDVVEIATGAKVEEALPDWRARIALRVDQEPAPLTPAERRELALDVDPDSEIEPSEPSPERVASLKEALTKVSSSNEQDEHENDRPRG